jgi:hypothetical protein
MDHRQALATRAAERYLLDEMSEPERFAFESHYFACAECAEDVRAARALALGVRAVCSEESALSARADEELPARAPRRGWFGWLSPAVLAPSAAALVFGVVAAYEGFLLMPGSRSQSASYAMAPIVLRAAARGEEQPLEVRRDRERSLFSLDVNSADPGTPLVYEIVAPGGGTRIRENTAAPPLATPLIVSVPHSAIRESGAWSLVLRTRAGAEIARYPFTVQLK